MVLRLAVVAALALAWAAPASAQNKPNVVLIVMDDVGYGDYGSYGAPDIKTPNVDRLARDGVKLTDFTPRPRARQRAQR
jgi:parvulin-like peptidyl-prolyl isomerase